MTGCKSGTLLLAAVLAVAVCYVDAKCSQYNMDYGCSKCDKTGKKCLGWCPTSEGAVSADASGKCYDCWEMNGAWCNVCWTPDGKNPKTGKKECKECWETQPDSEDPFIITKAKSGKCVACKKCLWSGGWASCDDKGRCRTCRVKDGYKRLPVKGRCVKSKP